MQHTVKPGDTLIAIARTHGVSLDDILALNPALRAHPDLIHVGQTIELPSPGNGLPTGTGVPPVSPPAPAPVHAQHTVKPGDTLSAIARAHGVSLQDILALNPTLRARPDLIHVGQTIELPSPGSSVSGSTGVPPVPPPAPAPVHPPAASGHVLGGLSIQFETGGRGPTTISTGHGDSGGVSYGSYQMTSAGGGTVGRFVSQPGFRFRTDFAGLTPGTPAFSAVWRDLATRMPVEFHEEEHQFIKATHFDVLCDKIKRDDGVTVTACSFAFQDVIWSTAVHHGGHADIVHVAFSAMRAAGRFNPSAGNFEHDAINAIYDERGRKDGNGTLVHFSGNSQAVQNGVASRFVRERADALKMLATMV